MCSRFESTILTERLAPVPSFRRPSPDLDVVLGGLSPRYIVIGRLRHLELDAVPFWIDLRNGFIERVYLLLERSRPRLEIGYLILESAGILIARRLGKPLSLPIIGPVSLPSFLFGSQGFLLLEQFASLPIQIERGIPPPRSCQRRPG